MGWIFGIDTALNCPATLLNVFLLECQMLARCNLDLGFDQINAGDHFRDRMLDLNPGVHLQEIKVLLRIN